MPIHPDDDTSTLETARERLYSPRSVELKVRQALSESSAVTVPHAWAAKIAPKAHPHVRLALLFFVGALAFFIVAAGVAALLLFSGSTSVSTNNISLVTQGPTTIAGGDTVPFSLSITNKNVVPLENATLEIDFPDGTRSATDETQAYPRYTEDLGTIAPGATVLRSVKAILFGGAGSSVSIPISLSYEAQGSNATFVKKSTYPLSITSAPLSLSVDAPVEAVSGQPLSLSVIVRSNATTALNNVVVQSQLPFGFKITSTSMPVSGASFLIGTLQPGVSKTVLITGVLTGQVNDQEAFHFTVGTGNSSTDQTPQIVYMAQDAQVAIQAPFLATTLALNGATAPSPTLSPGSNNSATVSWTNTLDAPLQNATISIKLSGAVVPNSIQTTTGFYDSSSNTITFSPSSDPSLASLPPGASGLGTFSFATPPAGSGSQSLTFTISISGTQTGQDTGPQQVNASSVVTAAIAGGVSLSAQSLHASGPISNSGPVPPVVGSATSYTILWQITNPGNALASPQVSATLPSYITFTNQTSGSGITYDSASRTVTWKPGDLTGGATATGAFQISFTPSSSQKGSTPELTSSVAFTAFDRYAQVQVSSSIAAPTTQAADPGASSGAGDVQ